MSATRDETRLTELYVASESRVEEGDATIRMRTGDVWVGQVKRKHAAEIVTAVNERERLRELLKAAVNAIRSYQYGNSSPDLADEIQQAVNAALSDQNGMGEG